MANVAEEREIKVWTDMWEAGDIPWANPDKHMWLVKGNNIDCLLRGKQNQTVFFPLCGDVVDMKWIGDLGHNVVGAELSKEALESFFKKHGITYTTEPAEKCKGTLYKSTDDTYRLYCCDFFEFNSDVAGKFDAIFDSGGLPAIQEHLRDRYVDVILELMREESICILEGVSFGERHWQGPPYGLTEDEARALYGNKSIFHVIDDYTFTFEDDSGDAVALPCKVYEIALKKSM